MKTTRILTLLSVLAAVCCRAMFAQSPSFSRHDVDTGLHLSGGVVVGDFDGDGKPDLLIGAFPPSGIYLMTGNGDGTFGTPSQVFSGFSSGLAAADVNGDGKLDILFAGADIELWVLLGNGDGTFDQNSPIRSPGVATGRPLLVADFNQDGKPDVAAADQGGGISILLGNGDGTFGPVKTYPITGGGFADSPVAADFNGDNKLDVAASNVQQSAISVLMGDGHGTFGAPSDFGVGVQPFPLVAADLNGDGKPDLAVGNYQSSSISVLLNQGGGNFLSKQDYAVGPFPVGLAAADFNGDGNMDFAVGGGLPVLSILSGNGDGTFAEKQDFPTLSSLESLVVGDLNGDGKPDVVVIYFAAQSTLSVFLNTTVVADTIPPQITVAARPRILWPPNGKMIPVLFSGRITDVGSGVDAQSAKFTVVDEYGRIQPSGSIRLSSDGSYSISTLLKSSRQGNDRDGRLYTMIISATDRVGNLASARTFVRVPHDRHR